jgi:hypothetical protein
MRVTSIRISGGLAWVLLPVAMLATLAAFGVAAAGVLSLVAVRWITRRGRRGSGTARGARASTTIELEPGAYRRIENSHRRQPPGSTAVH